MGENQNELDDLYPEAGARRDRTIAILESESVPYLERLPLIESETDIPRRRDREVALRAMALAVVALKGVKNDQAAVEHAEKFGIGYSLTPKELKFVSDAEPSADDRIQFSWRSECLHVMLWALGFEEELGRPDRQFDPAYAVDLLDRHGREGFLATARLRSARELLDAADLLYCYHWAVRDARLAGRSMPAGLNGDVVQEWHYALNWLIGYEDQEWDDITTDT
jgi:Domain of unknown function (DUF4272)